ncbi:unnamed protein product, partial [Durusdinium trenchii]
DTSLLPPRSLGYPSLMHPYPIGAARPWLGVPYATRWHSRPPRPSCRRLFRAAKQDIAALQTAKQVAEQTQHAALADAIDRQLLARWLAGQEKDLDEYETFFRATECSADGSQHTSHPPDLLEEWLQPLESGSVHSERDLDELRAEAEGVHIFDLKRDRASEAAAALRRDGFVALAALGPTVLRRARRLSAALLRRVARAEPRGNRGERRYSLGRTTMVPGTLELATCPAVCQVLESFWGTKSFRVQCTGGDASLPGAQQQDLHADVPVKEVADQLYNYYDPEQPDRKFMELPTPVVKVYFAMVDMDRKVGPPRFVPGTHELTAKQDIHEALLE